MSYLSKKLKSVIVLCLNLFGMLSFDAHAMGPQESKWWTDQFGSVVDFSQPFFNSLDQLASADLTPACKTQTQALLQATNAYAELASKHKHDAGDALKKLKASLPLSTIASDACSKAIVDTYLLAGIYLSGPDFLNLPANWSVMTIQNEMFLGVKQHLFRNLLLAARMIRNHQIVYLTDSLRTTYGPNWSSRAADGNYNLSGAYHCQSSQIYIDPNVGPFDLGAMFNHELSHLLRDKTFALKDFQNEFLAAAQGDAKTAWRRYLTLDETLAALNASQTERLQRPADSADATYRSWFGYGRPVMKNVDQYSAQGDFTFISPLGSPMENWYQSGSRILPLEALTNGLYSSTISAVAPYLDQTFKLVFSGYFPSLRISPEDESYLLRPFPSLDGVWSQIMLPDTWRPANQAGYDLNYELQAYADGKNIRLGVYEAVDWLELKLQGSSEMCDAFMDASEQGLIDDYLGQQYKLPVDPGTEGNRPGTEGNRPGTEGNRPELGIRPCLDFSRAL